MLVCARRAPQFQASCQKRSKRERALRVTQRRCRQTLGRWQGLPPHTGMHSGALTPCAQGRQQRRLEAGCGSGQAFGRRLARPCMRCGDRNPAGCIGCSPAGKRGAAARPCLSVFYAAQLATVAGGGGAHRAALGLAPLHARWAGARAVCDPTALVPAGMRSLSRAGTGKVVRERADVPALMQARLQASPDAAACSAPLPPAPCSPLQPPSPFPSSPAPSHLHAANRVGPAEEQVAGDRPGLVLALGNAALQRRTAETGRAGHKAWVALWPQLSRSTAMNSSLEGWVHTHLESISEAAAARAAACRFMAGLQWCWRTCTLPRDPPPGALTLFLHTLPAGQTTSWQASGGGMHLGLPSCERAGAGGGAGGGAPLVPRCSACMRRLPASTRVAGRSGKQPPCLLRR